MKKRILTIILSLSLFSFANEVYGGISQSKGESKVKPTLPRDPAEAFLCGAHPRLGQSSPIGRLHSYVLEYICDFVREEVVLTDADLGDFAALLVRLKNSYVTSLDLGFTNITSEQLAEILGKIGGDLRILNLRGCAQLDDFSSIAEHCLQLQNLNLKYTQITSEQLLKILSIIGRCR